MQIYTTKTSDNDFSRKKRPKSIMLTAQRVTRLVGKHLENKFS